MHGYLGSVGTMREVIFILFTLRPAFSTRSKSLILSAIFFSITRTATASLVFKLINHFPSPGAPGWFVHPGGAWPRQVITNPAVHAPASNPLILSAAFIVRQTLK